MFHGEMMEPSLEKIIVTLIKLNHIDTITRHETLDDDEVKFKFYNFSFHIIFSLNSSMSLEQKQRQQQESVEECRTKKRNASTTHKGRERAKTRPIFLVLNLLLIFYVEPFINN